MKHQIVWALAALLLTNAAAADPAEISLSAVGINVADIDRAERFYNDVFGFERTFAFPPGSDDPIEIGLVRPGGNGMMLLLAKLNDDPLPDAKSAYGRIVLMTNDALGLLAKAEAKGSTWRRVDDQSPTSPIIIFLTDPDGYEVELYQAPDAP